MFRAVLRNAEPVMLSAQEPGEQHTHAVVGHRGDTHAVTPQHYRNPSNCIILRPNTAETSATAPSNILLRCQMQEYDLQHLASQ